MSQVNFFMLPEDEADFVEVLAAREDTRVFPAHGLDIPATLHSNGLTLFNRKLGWPPIVDATEVEAPLRAFTSLDRYKEPHITWSRSYCEGKTLFAGRIYAKIGWLDQPTANTTCQRWYDSLARWIRQRYERQNRLWWVSPRARAWWHEGGLLSFGGRSDGRSFGE
jgi:hypothetical protein